jgi:tight adherence protein C
MIDNRVLTYSGFFLGSSLVFLLFMLLSGRKSRLDTRLRDLAGKGGMLPDEDSLAQLAHTTLPKIGVSLVPKDEGERSRLRTRLLQAGLYGPQAMYLFLGVKLLLIVSPALIGVAVGLVGMVPIVHGLICGAVLGIGGMIGPSFWLDRRKTTRQIAFRRALPDALDVLVICLEGGLSLTGALQRVAAELKTAHPLLATELQIVQREIQMGRSAGEALRQFADRTDLDEIRSLASVVIQTERFGASLVKALRVHAATLREKRLQRAEELAQKAAIKVLFPTLLFIFPGIFLVILGPAAIQILEMFSRINK